MSAWATYRAGAKHRSNHRTDVSMALFSAKTTVDKIEPIMATVNTKWRMRFEPDHSETEVPWTNTFVMEAYELGVTVGYCGRQGTYGIDDYWTITSSHGVEHAYDMDQVVQLLPRHCGWTRENKAVEAKAVKDIFEVLHYRMICNGKLNAWSRGKGETSRIGHEPRRSYYEARFFNEVYSGEASLEPALRTKLEDDLKFRETFPFLILLPGLMPLVPQIARAFQYNFFAGVLALFATALLMALVSTGLRALERHDNKGKVTGRRSALARMAKNPKQSRLKTLLPAYGEAR